MAKEIDEHPDPQFPDHLKSKAKDILRSNGQGALSRFVAQDAAFLLGKRGEGKGGYVAHQECVCRECGNVGCIG